MKDFFATVLLILFLNLLFAGGIYLDRKSNEMAQNKKTLNKYKE